MSQDVVNETVEVKDFSPVKAISTYESREVREQMKALSLEVFGKTSRYRKLYETKELVTHEVEEIVPGENGEPDTTKMVTVPLLFNKSKQYVMKYRSTEEVLQLLLEFKTKREEFIAQMKAQQEEQQAKKELDDLAKKIQEGLSGSAIK